MSCGTIRIDAASASCEVLEVDVLASPVREAWRLRTHARPIAVHAMRNARPGTAPQWSLQYRIRSVMPKGHAASVNIPVSAIHAPGFLAISRASLRR